MGLLWPYIHWPPAIVRFIHLSLILQNLLCSVPRGTIQMHPGPTATRVDSPNARGRSLMSPSVDPRRARSHPSREPGNRRLGPAPQGGPAGRVSARTRPGNKRAERRREGLSRHPPSPLRPTRSAPRLQLPRTPGPRPASGRTGAGLRAALPPLPQSPSPPRPGAESSCGGARCEPRRAGGLTASPQGCGRGPRGGDPHTGGIRCTRCNATAHPGGPRRPALRLVGT